MKLQLALDMVTLEQAMEILRQVHQVIDIVEIGTPFIVHEGMEPVRRVRKAFPDLQILADVKIMDAGEYEAQIAMEAGADIVTVLGVSGDETILAATQKAHSMGGKILVDMINVHDLVRRAREIDKLGVDYICVHTAFDVQGSGRNPIAELAALTEAGLRAETAVAGGIKLSTIAQVADLKPGILIVGGGITNQADMADAARRMKAIMAEKE